MRDGGPRDFGAESAAARARTWRKGSGAGPASREAPVPGPKTRAARGLAPAWNPQPRPPRWKTRPKWASGGPRGRRVLSHNPAHGRRPLRPRRLGVASPTPECSGTERRDCGDSRPLPPRTHVLHPAPRRHCRALESPPA
jgi:hypothetical protein